jgi:hypothetical protein
MPASRVRTPPTTFIGRTAINLEQYVKNRITEPGPGTQLSAKEDILKVTYKV